MIDRINETADLVADTLAELQRLNGTPTNLMLEGAYVAIIMMMTTHLGGNATAEACEVAARMVRGLPPAPPCSLAQAVPAGRA